MAKRYARLNWQNKPSVATPVSAANLNRMDKGIDDLDIYKIDTDHLVNNRVTTEPGFALDARQANPNIPGTLGASINEITNNLASYGYPTPVVVTDLNSVPINVRSTVFIGWGEHPSKPNEHNFVMETIPLTGTGVALQVLYDYDAAVTSDPIRYVRQNHGTSGTNWVDNNLANNLANKLSATTARFRLGEPGWYRVARYGYKGLAGSTIKGASCNSVNISIKRNYNGSNNEYYSLLLMSVFDKSQFIKIGKLINTQNITKIRHTVDPTNGFAYLEIYYNASTGNGMSITLLDNEDGQGITLPTMVRWATIPPVATAETVSGVDVMSTMDLTTA